MAVDATNWETYLDGAYVIPPESLATAVLQVVETTWEDYIEVVERYEQGAENLTTSAPVLVTADWVQYRHITYSNFNGDALVIVAPVITNTTWS